MKKSGGIFRRKRRDYMANIKYDAVVIGAGNGGLMAAARLAKEGKKVLLLEKHNLPGGSATSFRRGRFEFEASLHELCGMAPFTGKGTLRSMLDELEITDKIEWTALDEAYSMTVLDEDNKCYVLPAKKEPFIDAVEKYVPGSRPYSEKIFALIEEFSAGADFLTTISDFNKGVIDEIFGSYSNFLNLASYTMEDVYDAIGVPQKVRDLFNGYWCYLGTNTKEMSAAHYFIMCHSYIIDGPIIPNNRSHDISNTILERFTELGGDAWFNTKVEKIIVKDKTAKGIILSDGTQIDADIVIANCSPYTAITKMIDRNEIPDFRKKEVNANTLAPKGFAIFLGLNKSADELGIDHHTYFIYETMDTVKQEQLMRRRETNNMQATVCLNRGYPDCSPEGTSILYLTAIFPGTEAWNDITPENYVKIKREFADKMITNFEKATGIAIRDNIEEIEIASPVTYARYLGAPAGTIYGYDNKGSNGIIHRIMTDAMGEKIKNLYFCGGYTKQSIGFNPAYMTGWSAAGDALAAEKKEAESDEK